MKRPQRTTFTASVVLLFALTGCGGSDGSSPSDSADPGTSSGAAYPDKPADVVVALLSAVAAEDCPTYVKFASEESLDPDGIYDCKHYFSDAIKDRPELSAFRVKGTPEVTGSKASVEVEYMENGKITTVDADAVLEHGVWKVDVADSDLIYR